MYELGLFAKFWKSGKVKTRLAAKTGELAASRIYQVFLRHLIRVVGSAEILERRTIVFSPPEHESDFRSLLESDTSPNSSPFGRVPQLQVSDLGQRMKGYFQEAFNAEGASTKPVERVVVIGSDTPDLTAGVFNHVHQQLDEHPVVVGPSTDGGYYLIAIRNHSDVKLETIYEIFSGIQWSTPQVLAQTTEKMERLGIAYGLLPPMTDVDHHADLLKLVDRMRQSSDSSHRQLLSELETLNLDSQVGGFLDE